MSKTRALFALARDSASDDLLCCLCLFGEVQLSLTSFNTLLLASHRLEAGRFRFDSLPAGDYSLDFDKAGFFRLTNHTVTAGTPSTEIIVTMNHESEFISQFEALGKRVRIDEGDVSNIDLTLIPSM